MISLCKLTAEVFVSRHVTLHDLSNVKSVLCQSLHDDIDIPWSFEDNHSLHRRTGYDADIGLKRRTDIIRFCHITIPPS